MIAKPSKSSELVTPTQVSGRVQGIGKPPKSIWACASCGKLLKKSEPDTWKLVFRMSRLEVWCAADHVAIREAANSKNLRIEDQKARQARLSKGRAQPTGHISVVPGGLPK